MRGYPLISVVAWYALVALMVAELRGEHGNEDTIKKPQCETPQPPFYNLSDKCDESDILFIFNTTSGLCEDILIDPRYHNNTFKSRFECVSTCNPGQGASFCADSPWNACNGSAEESDESYFYNVSSRKCEEYQDCGGNIQKTMDVNGFYDYINCNFQCLGFTESDVHGCNKTKQVD
uniref:Putative serine proteinase inhibitor n=1 Tax=Amblyomma cajennense TaxID=34607 RepID=A0A023FTI6_AMBCJ